MTELDTTTRAVLAMTDALELQAVIDAEVRRDPEALRLTPKSFAYAVAQAWQQRLSERSWHCNICGGTVDLSNATKPTVHVGQGGR